MFVVIFFFCDWSTLPQGKLNLVMIVSKHCLIMLYCLTPKPPGRVTWSGWSTITGFMKYSSVVTNIYEIV